MSQREQVEIERLRRKIAATASAGLLAANNLSDLLSAATARNNLGLGSIATEAAATYATAADLATLAARVTVNEAELLILAGLHGAEFTNAFSSAFWAGVDVGGYTQPANAV